MKNPKRKQSTELGHAHFGLFMFFLNLVIGPAAKSASKTPQRSSVQRQNEEQLNGVERILDEVKTEAPSAISTG